MVKLFTKTFSFFTRQQTGILSAASIIMMTVAASRILGLVRDRMLTSRFTPDDLGVYYAAFRLPNLIFELLVMGALSTAFIPVFTSYLETDRKKDAFKIASSVINIGFILLAILSIPILIFTPLVCRFLAPGFSDDQIALMVPFTRIMVLAQVAPLLIGNFFTGILQSFRNFIIPALAPVLYNLGIILGIILFTSSAGLFAPVYGVVLGSILFTAIQFPLVFIYGYRHSWSFDIKNQGVRDIGKLMGPRTFGLAISQIDTTVDLMLSSLLGSAAVTIFNLAQHLQQMPIGLFGASLAQATFPSLSGSWVKKNIEEFKSLFLVAFHQILFWIVPISAILIVLRIPMVRLVFGAKRFDWEATVLTGKTLAFFSLSLFAQSLVHLLARGFFALHDSKTPVAIGGVAVMINTILSILFIKSFHLPIWSLGLSTSIASIFNALFLLIYLDKKVGRFPKAQLIIPVIKIFLAGLVTGFALYIPIKLLDQLVFDTTRTFSLLILTGISTSIGMSVYLLLAWFLEIPEFSMFFKLLKRAEKLKGIFIEPSQEVVNVPE
ncbi:murein biosynthesis integral membrane protein MurJ [Candidatus Gottesmanbacteria bacterium]|nr:murein biosynthesis integral membrane protein MurJ [Candidatus Gottesmanbacteria bacterium]